MKLKINNSKSNDPFVLEYKPITLDIYYAQFGRDLTQDTLDCIKKYGSITRSLTIRLVWSMCTTHDQKFMTFLDFIDCLEYKIDDFVNGWGSEFFAWFFPLLDADFSK